MNHLCVRSVEKKTSLSGKVYFQLKVSKVDFFGLPEDLVDLYNCDVWVTAKEDEYKLNIFHIGEYKKALKWCFIDYYEGDFGDVTLGLNIGEINAPFKGGSDFYYKNIENLYGECMAGTIKSGCLFAGVIASYDVEYYKFDGKIVSSYTCPILWQEELSDEQQLIFIKKVFAQNGKIIIDKREKDKREERTSFRDNNSYHEYDGPSDGYGGYLEDDFINDVLDGDEDAYWNLD